MQGNSVVLYNYSSTISVKLVRVHDKKGIHAVCV